MTHSFGDTRRAHKHRQCSQTRRKTAPDHPVANCRRIQAGTQNHRLPNIRTAPSCCCQGALTSFAYIVYSISTSFTLSGALSASPYVSQGSSSCARSKQRIVSKSDMLPSFCVPRSQTSDSERWRDHSACHLTALCGVGGVDGIEKLSWSLSC